MAPPFTLTLAGSASRSFSHASTTEAKASLISTTSMSASCIPARCKAWRVAGMGAVSIQTGSAARTDRWWMRARGVRPCSATARSDAMSSAAEPSEIWLETAAVSRPSGIRVRSPAIFSRVVPRRGPSSVVTSPSGAISRSKRPPSMAAIARSWLRRAKASMSAREMSHFAAIISALLNWLSWSPP